jgi:hypothetical protein
MDAQAGKAGLHFIFPDLAGRIDRATLERNGWPAPGTTNFKAINPPALEDTRFRLLSSDIHVAIVMGSERRAQRNRCMIEHGPGDHRTGMLNVGLCTGVIEHRPQNW